MITKNAPAHRTSDSRAATTADQALEALLEAATADGGRARAAGKAKLRSSAGGGRVLLEGMMRDILADIIEEKAAKAEGEARPETAKAPKGRAAPTLDLVLGPVKDREIDLLESFLSVLHDEALREAIEDSKTFSDILEYAIGRGLVRQTPLAERLSYATSQVGRWAAHKAAPPMIVRRAVIDEMAAMISESLEELRRAQTRVEGRRRAAAGARS